MIKKCGFFLISSMVLSLLNQLQIFLPLYLTELLGLLTGLGLLELYHLIYPGLLTGFGILVFFTNLSLMEFQVRYLVLCDQASDLWQQLELALNLNLIYETL